MRLKFGDCILDLRSRQLERAGQIVSMEPKVYELLEVLVARRPAVVTNNELDELLWPKSYVARTSLTRLVSELRAALGDTPRDSQIIRTAYKKGYAFCANDTCILSTTALPATIELVWKKQCLSLADGEYLAGRDADCALVIDAATVSRRHARIMVASGAATIEDLGSTNGTHVDGVCIAGPTPLSPGNQLALGQEVVQVRARHSLAPTLKVVPVN